MAYQISATKLQTYHRCPQAYQFRYELGLKSNTFFGSAALGTALHQALAQVYQDWCYSEPLPPLSWLHHCWEQHCNNLSPIQVEEGKQILQIYYQNFIATEKAIHKPLAVEGKIQAGLQVANLEFAIAGRYDRIDYVDGGLELVDYKSTKEVKLPKEDEIDLQIGLYYLALEQRYRQSLRKLSLIYLRTGEKVSFDATPEHKERVEDVIGELAWQLRTDCEWEPKAGEQCERCTYSRYCSAVQDSPEPLPDDIRSHQPQLQLVLAL
ncbi:PD-(D/E)XK nuclease family protein [Chroococcidiopsis sp. FACHB-1243]|uniref:RecB family exonuclease n=1 Tax=Chroococcidiopsis sp. [FACHB-1243] TaxID=2692781 RepID=UPI001785C536|nr:PD-(D/E)XK nuclease family protein [Chroococcidiopsis sp. [FACHB-1243]]MBD2309106.1 PD-(D/E)XK nuclease family protein [Chroococcidiopsis sp. [FACHB-1243]]